MTWKTPAIGLIALVSISALIFFQNQNKVLGDSIVLLNPQVEAPAPSPSTTQVSQEVASFSASISTVVIPPTVSATSSSEVSSISAKIVKKVVKPTPTAKPQPEFTSEQIYKLIDKYASQYSIDPNVLRHVALCESGFNPKAKNLIYAGLFQYDVSTWKNYRLKLGLDTDPDLRYHAEEAIRTTAYAFSLGASRLWPGCYPK